MEKQVLNIDEAAKRIGITTRLLRHWVHLRRVPHLRLGDRTLRFREADLNAFLERHMVQADAERKEANHEQL